ncbi:MAG: InlB B-repeat-containing protein [Cystobacterineae bacterium]|nr:InlB B-repeat-containing protein [Cystobacterineae bacterium]
MKTTQNLSLSREFPLKRFSIGMPHMLLSVLLSAALSACSSSTPETIIEPLEGVYTVIFDKNGGDTEANPQSKRVEPPETTLDELPEAPTREGYTFLGWNTAADGSGTPFTADVLVRENLTVYAQWANLNISILPSAEILTPLIDGTYNEHFTTFRVVVSGFDNAADASKASLDIEPISGLRFEVESNPEGNTQNFEVRVEYDGQAAFPEGFATFNLNLANISGYSAGHKSTRIDVRDGQAAGPSRAIPLNQANIVAFNHYANTAAGLTQHYRLTENISLAEPAQPMASNWVAIGTTEAPFVGSLNGENHEFLRLRMRASGSNYQGLFGYIGLGATLQNIRLTEASVHGGHQVGSLVGYNLQGTVHNSYATGSVNGSNNNVGGLVGVNYGGTVQNSYATVSVNGNSAVGGLVGNNYSNSTVQNSYATGSVTSSGTDTYGDAYVGGLVGSNSGGTVENSYATGSVNGSGYYVGGLLGSNSGTVHNSYATGNVSGSSFYVGGLVGYNSGTVENSHATGSVSASSYIGGLVGRNYGGTVQNSYATGSVTGSSYDVGGLVGYNYEGTVQNSYATGSVSGSSTVGGLVGINFRGTVENSYATGSVTGSGTDAYNGLDVGGLVGSNNSGTVQNSYATGNVSGNGWVGGLVGRNSGTVQNSLALNPRVSGTTNVGRVAGINEDNGTLTNNHAFDGMQNSAGNTSWGNTSLNNSNGADISAGLLRRRDGFPPEFLTTPWTYVEGQLPGLGQPVDMPAHIP